MRPEGAGARSRQCDRGGQRPVLRTRTQRPLLETAADQLLARRLIHQGIIPSSRSLQANVTKLGCHSSSPALLGNLVQRVCAHIDHAILLLQGPFDDHHGGQAKQNRILITQLW